MTARILKQGLALISVILAASVPPSVGANPPVMIASNASRLLAEAGSEYGIRPAQDARLGSPRADESREGSPPTDQAAQSHDEGGIRYLSGGVGESERTELNAQSSQYNLHLMFAKQGSGEYLSAVRVNILDARGTPVLTTQSTGPWFFVQLPPGDYSVEATPTVQVGLNQTQRKQVHITESGQSKSDFYWSE